MTSVGGTDDYVWLPSGAPSELRDFIEGDSSSVEIDTTAIRWLPPPIDAPVLAEPSMSIRAGSTPTAVTIEVAWSRAGTTSVIQLLIVDGRLRVSSSELAPSAARRLSEWVAAFNRELSVSDRQLDSLRVQGPILTVTTRSPFPPPRSPSMTPFPVALAGLLALRPPTTPVAPWRHRTRAAKLLSVAAIVLLIGGGAAVVTATWLDDSDSESEPLPSIESTASTSVTTSVPSGPCATDPDADVAACGPPPAPPTTWTASTTSTTSTTTLPSGPCATDPDADVAACGPPPVPPPGDDPSDDGVRCVEPDVPVDVDNDGITDTCTRVYPVAVIPPTGGLPTQGEAVPPRPIPATGSDSYVSLHLGVLLILAGLIAMVAGHRRAGDENS